MIGICVTFILFSDIYWQVWSHFASRQDRAGRAQLGPYALFLRSLVSPETASSTSTTLPKCAAAGSGKNQQKNAVGLDDSNATAANTLASDSATLFQGDNGMNSDVENLARRKRAFHILELAYANNASVGAFMFPYLRHL